MADIYIALLHPPEAGSEWGVTFPDFPGCVSGGKTFEEACSLAGEALAGHVAAMLADGDAISLASTYDRLVADAVFAEEVKDGALPIGVPLIEVAAPKERVNVMLDRGVLRKIDEAARARGVSRSAFIEQAAGKAALKRSA